MVIGAMDINTDHFDCIRATDSDMALGSSPGPDINVVLDGKQTSYVNHFLIAFDSSDLTLSTAHKSFCLSLSHFPTIYSLIIIVPVHPVPQASG